MTDIPYTGEGRMFEDDEDRRYEVVINLEEQYSIWPLRRALPGGWRAVGMSGSKAECLAHIDTVWTDMRPLTVRQHSAAQPQQNR